MSFADAIARDAEFIHGRTGGEFVADVEFWTHDQDPDNDTADESGRGSYFIQPSNRAEDDKSQHTMTAVVVTVPTSLVTSVDPQGFMSVDGVLYTIEYAHQRSGTWTVRGARDPEYAIGDIASAIGG